MKVNPVGINSYRQAMERPQAENRQNVDSKTTQTAKTAAKTESVNITDQIGRVGSKLAVHLKPGTFVDMLSAEEKQAMQMAFEKYSASEAENGTYAKNGASEMTVKGSLVDVKL